MASITITTPTTNSTVSWNFGASGNYTTTTNDPCPNSDVAKYSVRCVLFDSDGQEIQEHIYGLPTPVPAAGTWGVSFNLSEDYADCTLTAQLQMFSTPYPTATITGLDVTHAVAYEDAPSEQLQPELCEV